MLGAQISLCIRFFLHHLISFCFQFSFVSTEGLSFLSGDDWEHEEIFTDDDEAVGNDPEEREDLAPEIPAPPEIKQVGYVWDLQILIVNKFTSRCTLQDYVMCMWGMEVIG